MAPKSKKQGSKAAAKRASSGDTTTAANTPAPVETTVEAVEVEQPVEAPAAPTQVVAYKGFDSNLACRGYQYEIGKTFEHKGYVSACAAGFHSCTSPFDVWNYYGPVESRFARVIADGDISRGDDDSKIASARITIECELTLPEFIKAGVEWLIDLTRDLTSRGVATSGALNDNGERRKTLGSSGYGARIGSSGYGARIGSSGYGAQIGSSGDGAQIGSSGDGAQIGSSGDGARIGSSGDGAQIGSSGDGARIGSSGDGAQIGSSGDGARIGSSGDGARIGSSGDGAQIGSSGDGARIGSSGKKGIVAASGYVELLSLGEGGCAAVPYFDGTRTRFAIAYEGENVRAGVKYRVDSTGKFVEVRL